MTDLSMIVTGFIILLKYIIPLLIIFNPFVGGWLNFVLDSIDGDLLVPLGLSAYSYQLVDKSADWITYIGMLLAAFKYNWLIKRWIGLFFILRTIGQLLFFLTNDERIFFLFPNFLEPLFLVYATITIIKGKKTEKFFIKHKTIIWILVIIYKIQDEWITHIANIDRTDLILRMLSG
jgi:hypothetical protein